jgi:hypothetical protein
VDIRAEIDVRRAILRDDYHVSSSQEILRERRFLPYLPIDDVKPGIGDRQIQCDYSPNRQVEA